ncbi:MAG: hypothetical protein P8Y70_13315 [Candidatus Lokiarchaeota archaeon]
MSRSSSYAYCPYCKTTQKLKREDFNVWLSIVLLIFTGIGFFIYLIYHYTKPKDRCYFCGTIIQHPQAMLEKGEYVKYGNIASREIGTRIEKQKDSDEEIVQIRGDTIKYCRYCGGELKEDSKFCPSCGSIIYY